MAAGVGQLIMDFKAGSWKISNVFNTEKEKMSAGMAKPATLIDGCTPCIHIQTSHCALKL